MIAVCALTVFAWALHRRILHVLIGPSEPRFDRPITRTLGGPTVAEESVADILLYWPGCAGTLDARNQKVSAAVVELARRADISIVTLDSEERCCGDPARRLGNEYLFQGLALENIDVLNRHGVKRILTQCPHRFNTLKHEYRQLGGEFEVLHHAEFLLSLVDQGRLRLKPKQLQEDQLADRKRVAYHDSCYLGRYNDIYE